MKGWGLVVLEQWRNQNTSQFNYVTERHHPYKRKLQCIWEFPIPLARARTAYNHKSCEYAVFFCLQCQSEQWICLITAFPFSSAVYMASPVVSNYFQDFTNAMGRRFGPFRCITYIGSAALIGAFVYRYYNNVAKEPELQYVKVEYWFLTSP